MYGGEEIYVTCQFKNGDHGVGFGIRNGVVQEISLAPHRLSFGDVAQKLGDPDHVGAILHAPLGKSYSVKLFYVRQGFQVEAWRSVGILGGDKYLTQLEEQRRVLLSKEMQVYYLTYVPPAASIEEFYTPSHVHRPCRLQLAHTRRNIALTPLCRAAQKRLNAGSGARR
jgi:hypothetical protein